MVLPGMCLHKIKCVTQLSASHLLLKAALRGSRPQRKENRISCLTKGDEKLKKKGIPFFSHEFCNFGYSSVGSFAF